MIDNLPRTHFSAHDISYLRFKMYIHKRVLFSACGYISLLNKNSKIMCTYKRNHHSEQYFQVFLKTPILQRLLSGTLSTLRANMLHYLLCSAQGEHSGLVLSAWKAISRGDNPSNSWRIRIKEHITECTYLHATKAMAEALYCGELNSR